MTDGEYANLVLGDLCFYNGKQACVVSKDGVWISATFLEEPFSGEEIMAGSIRRFCGSIRHCPGVLLLIEPAVSTFLLRLR
jgi:hypothetical protein